MDPYSGGRVTLAYRIPGQGVTLSGDTRIAFWLKARNEHIPAWQGENPIVTLVGAADRQCTFTPSSDFLSRPADNEARDSWTHFVVPLSGSHGLATFRSGLGAGSRDPVRL